MSVIISVILYACILFGLSALLFTLLDSMWGTSEPAIVYLLCLIFTHLVLNAIDRISKK